jgi:hypothetical protein
MTITRYGRYWAVLDTDGSLICLCVYKRGALEVLRRLQGQDEVGGVNRNRLEALSLLAAQFKEGERRYARQYP